MDNFQTRESTPKRVELKKVIFKSSGRYRCQVTASVRSKGSYGYHNQGFTMEESINREGATMFLGITALWFNLCLYRATLAMPLEYYVIPENS